MTHSPKTHYTGHRLSLNAFQVIGIMQNIFSFHTGIELEIRNSKISQEYLKIKTHNSKYHFGQRKRIMNPTNFLLDSLRQKRTENTNDQEWQGAHHYRVYGHSEIISIHYKNLITMKLIAYQNGHIPWKSSGVIKMHSQPDNLWLKEGHVFINDWCWAISLIHLQSSNLLLSLPDFKSLKALVCLQGNVLFLNLKKIYTLHDLFLAYLSSLFYFHSLLYLLF